MGLWSDLKNLATNQDYVTGRYLKEVSDSAARVKESPFSFKTWADFGMRSLLSASSMVMATVPAAVYYGAKHGVKMGIDTVNDHPKLSGFSLGIIPVVAGIVVGIESTAAVALGGSLAVAGFAASTGVSCAALVVTGVGAVVGSVARGVGSTFFGKEKVGAEDANQSRLNEARKRAKEAEAENNTKEGKDNPETKTTGKKAFKERFPRNVSSFKTGTPSSPVR